MKTTFLAALLFISFKVFSQPAYTGQYNFKGDPAAAYNKYLVAQNNRTYMQIGRYKVMGTPYLFGIRHVSNLYAKGETGLNIYASYNTYNQEIEFFSTSNPTDALIKEPGTVDSFILKKDSLIAEDMLFIYGNLLSSSDKSYYQLLAKGHKYSVYKKYKSDLAVPESYVEAELRQFELQSEYYYYNEEKKELKKIKWSYSTLKKEFSFVPDIENILTKEGLSKNNEAALKYFFLQVNQK